MKDNSEATDIPAIGAEVLVNITPSLRSDQKWMQFGHVLTARQDSSGLICGTIRITRPMTADENPRGWQSDGKWNGCDVAAVLNKYSNDWRATCPLSALAKAMWEKCWEIDGSN